MLQDKFWSTFMKKWDVKNTSLNSFPISTCAPPAGDLTIINSEYKQLQENIIMKIHYLELVIYVKSCPHFID